MAQSHCHGQCPSDAVNHFALQKNKTKQTLMDHLNLFCTEDAVMFWGLYSNSFFSFQDVVCSGITLWLYETLNIFSQNQKTNHTDVVFDFSNILVL